MSSLTSNSVMFSYAHSPACRQKQIGELLVSKLQNGELLPEEEAELSAIRMSIHRRMLKYSAAGLIAGVLGKIRRPILSDEY